MHNPNKTTLRQQFKIAGIVVCMGCLFLFWHHQHWKSHLVDKVELHNQSLSIHYRNSGKTVYIDYRELHQVNLNCKGSLSYCELNLYWGEDQYAQTVLRQPTEQTQKLRIQILEKMDRVKS